MAGFDKFTLKKGIHQMNKKSHVSLLVITNVKKQFG